MIARRPRWAILAASLALLCPALLAPQADAACSKPVFKDPNTVVDCPAIGAEQTFRVPAGVRSVRVIATGGGGGDGSFSAICTGFVPTPPCTNVGPGGRGGVGAIASGDLLVRPGRTLYVLAGGRGATQQGPAAGSGGFNGGASGGVLRLGNGFSNYLSGGGGGGGGASDVRTCSISDRSCDTLASRLIVAAGGGGGGGDVSFGNVFAGEGGTGGGVVGDNSDGSAPDGGAGGQGGSGATATAGGRAGSAAAAGGSASVGGHGADFGQVSEQGAGGGGGGGLFGGGGGSADADRSTPGAGGGGGSSFGPRGTRFAHAARPEPGSVRVVYLSRRIARHTRQREARAPQLPLTTHAESAKGRLAQRGSRVFRRSRRARPVAVPLGGSTAARPAGGSASQALEAKGTAACSSTSARSAIRTKPPHAGGVPPAVRLSRRRVSNTDGSEPRC
jgi:hypothetical protein